MASSRGEDASISTDCVSAEDARASAFEASLEDAKARAFQTSQARGRQAGEKVGRLAGQSAGSGAGQEAGESAVDEVLASQGPCPSSDPDLCAVGTIGPEPQGTYCPPPFSYFMGVCTVRRPARPEECPPDGSPRA